MADPAVAGLGTASPTALAARRRWEPADVVVAVTTVLLVIVFAIFAFLCWQGYAATLNTARTKAQTAADIVGNEAQWMLGSGLALLTHVAETVTADPAGMSALRRDTLEAGFSALPGRVRFGLYDASGNAMSGGNPSLPKSLAGTAEFTALAAGKDWTLTPLEVSASGAATFSMLRHIGGNGRFAGAAVLTFDASLLETFWAPQNLGPGSTVSIARDDGMLVARYPAVEATIDLSKTSPFWTQAERTESGTYVSARSPVDGIARVVAYRHIPSLGFVSFASVSQDAAIAALWTAIITVLWLMGPIALALLIGSLLTARLLRQSARTQKSLAAAVAHNDVLFREIHHRVKNNLQSVASLLQMQPIPREIKANMGQRIAAMSAVHEHIYRSNDFSTVRIKTYLETLIENIRAGADPSVNMVEHLDDLSVDKDAATPLGLIVNEVVANAYKHAFSDGRAGLVTVTMTRDADGLGRLTVEDNGVGFDPEQPGKGIGRRLIAALTEQLGGKSSFSTRPDAGSRFVLTFPLAR